MSTRLCPLPASSSAACFRIGRCPSPAFTTALRSLALIKLTLSSQEEQKTLQCLQDPHELPLRHLQTMRRRVAAAAKTKNPRHHPTALEPCSTRHCHNSL